MTLHGATFCWAAIHVYHAGSLDRMLVRAVAPLVRDLLVTGKLEDFFFIRYGIGGPHLRLRLLGDQHRLDEYVIPKVHTGLATYLKHYPSSQRPFHTSPQQTRSHLAPNDSVQDAEYAPETERYGGPVGMRLSEAHFCASSWAVLEAMSARGNDWSYEKAMGIAIQMHLAFAHGLDMDLHGAANFFSRLSLVFLPHAVAALTGSKYRRLAPDEEHRALELFTAALAPRRKQIVEYHASVWDRLLSGRSSGQPWLDGWIRSARENGVAFTASDQVGELTYPAWWFRVHPDIPNEPSTRLILIVSSLIHMSNNRLGIKNRDEAYLMYVLARALEDLSATGGMKGDPC